MQDIIICLIVQEVQPEFLHSSTNEAVQTDTNSLTSFDTDGFTLGSSAGVNLDNKNHVAWCWKANGGTTTAIQMEVLQYSSNK